jgi:hypothetical protein
VAEEGKATKTDVGQTVYLQLLSQSRLMLQMLSDATCAAPNLERKREEEETAASRKKKKRQKSLPAVRIIGKQ